MQACPSTADIDLVAPLLSAHAASAQAVLEMLPPPVFDQQGPAVDLSHTANLLNNTPQFTLPGHVNIPGTGANHGHNAPRHRNGNAADAVGALIGLGIVAGAIHAANQPRTRSVRIECPQGTQATATPIGSGAGTGIHRSTLPHAKKGAQALRTPPAGGCFAVSVIGKPFDEPIRTSRKLPCSAYSNKKKSSAGQCNCIAVGPKSAAPVLPVQ